MSSISRFINIFLVNKSDIIETGEDCTDWTKEYLKLQLMSDLDIMIKTQYYDSQTESALDILELFNKHSIDIPMEDVIPATKDNIEQEEKQFDKLFFPLKRLGPVGKVGTPYVYRYNCGGLNQDIIIKVSNSISVYSNFVSCESKRNDSTCLKKNRCFSFYKLEHNTSCLPSHNTIKRVIGSSEYVNETIIGYILNLTFFPHLMNSRRNYPLKDYLKGSLVEGSMGNSVFQMGFFQESGKKSRYGFNVMEKADNTLDKLMVQKDGLSPFQSIRAIINGKEFNGNDHPDIIFLVLMSQLNNTMIIITRDYAFNHGDLKAGNFFYKIDSEYMNIDYPINPLDPISKHFVKTNIRLKIADYGKSSLTFNGTRYFCDEAKIKPLITLGEKTGHYPAQKAYESMLSENGPYVFGRGRIGDVQAALRHTGCPFFLSADYYTLIISWAIQSPEILDMLTRYKFLNHLFPEVIPDILQIDNIYYKRFIESKKPKKLASINTAFELLDGLVLQCDAIDRCYKLCNELLIL